MVLGSIGWYHFWENKTQQVFLEEVGKRAPLPEKPEKNTFAVVSLVIFSSRPKKNTSRYYPKWWKVRESTHLFGGKPIGWWNMIPFGPCVFPSRLEAVFPRFCHRRYASPLCCVPVEKSGTFLEKKSPGFRIVAMWPETILWFLGGVDSLCKCLGVIPKVAFDITNKTEGKREALNNFKQNGANHRHPNTCWGSVFGRR